MASAATSTSPGTSSLGALHSYQIAVDGLQMATASTTNAPANITCGDIVGIYSGTITTWNQITGNSGGSSATIIPVKPQTGSGTLSDFESVLKACNGGVTVVYGVNVTIGEEHDPSALVGKANAIAPFSSGRYNLLQGGYLSTYTAGTTTVAGSLSDVAAGATRTLYFRATIN